MRNVEMERDLTRHLQHAIGEVMERHVRTASKILDPTSVALILIQASVSVTLTTVATVAMNTPADDPEEYGRLFDFTCETIANLVRGDRERTIAAIGAKKREVVA